MSTFMEPVAYKALWRDITGLETSVGNFSPAMGARNQVGIGLSYRPASLCSLATQCQTWFLESIPRPIAGLKFSTPFSEIPRRFIIVCFLSLSAKV
jgi:hypothetical protein